jgi:hypothetical protein
MTSSTSHSDVLSYQDYPKEPVEIENISLEFMKKSCFVPIAITDGTFEIAIADPGDFNTIAALKFAYGLEVKVKKGNTDDILDAIERLYGTGRQSMETIIEEAGKDMANGANGGQEDESHLRDLASEAPIIRLVNRLIVDAVEIDASDIHFEPYEDEFKVRYRIDGVLSDVDSPPKQFQQTVSSRHHFPGKTDGKTQYFGTPSAAGRAHKAESPGQRSGLPGFHRTDLVWRKPGDAHPEPGDAPARSSEARFPAIHPGTVCSTGITALRHDPGNRPHRQRQDLHTLCDAVPAEFT